MSTGYGVHDDWLAEQQRLYRNRMIEEVAQGALDPDPDDFILGFEDARRCTLSAVIIFSFAIKIDAFAFKVQWA